MLWIFLSWIGKKNTRRLPSTTGRRRGQDAHVSAHPPVLSRRHQPRSQSQFTHTQTESSDPLSFSASLPPRQATPMAARALLMLREASPWALAGAAAAVALLWLVAWTAEWAWWTPWRLDRALRAQGLKGTRYRLFTGDLAENARINREARTKPQHRPTRAAHAPQSHQGIR